MFGVVAAAATAAAAAETATATTTATKEKTSRIVIGLVTDSIYAQRIQSAGPPACPAVFYASTDWPSKL